MPPQEGISIPEENQNKIMHISLPISKETILMGSDTGGECTEKTTNDNNISLSITADSKDQADTFFDKLSRGGKVTMPMESTFWGDYFGMLTDQFGIKWMISFNENCH